MFAFCKNLGGTADFIRPILFWSVGFFIYSLYFRLKTKVRKKKMREKLEAIRQKADAELSTFTEQAQLENFRVQVLGK